MFLYQVLVDWMTNGAPIMPPNADVATHATGDNNEAFKDEDEDLFGVDPLYLILGGVIVLPCSPIVILPHIVYLVICERCGWKDL